MSNAVIVSEYGDTDVLKFQENKLAAPGAGEVLVKNEAIGLNFIEIYHRIGLYPLPLPFIPGQESAGIITAVGEGVTDFAIGDRVCCYSVSGSYAEERILPANKLIPVPDGVSLDIAAAITLKGMTALYLLEMTWEVKPSDTILFHAAAGGVGQIAVQWAKSLGATVIGTVGSDEKAQIARDLGCDHVINIETEDFTKRTREITNDRGVDVVYDSIGKDTFEKSLDCLRPRGLMVSFGNSSGPVTIPNLGVLAAKGGLFVTRPTTGNYYSDRSVELASAAKLFKKVQDGEIKVTIGNRFPLANVADAHSALKARKTIGSTILQP